MSRENAILSQSAMEIMAGSFSGVVQVLVGQPFDTIKVRLQSNQSNAYSGTLDCVSQTVRKEGISALYKGTLSPLMGIAFCVSIQFATLEEIKRYFRARNSVLGSGSDLTPGQFYVAGALAGVANSIVSCPVEHIRTRMQVQPSGGSQQQYKSTLDCFKKIWSQFGLRGIYKGQSITMLREWQGYGGYFFAYEMLVQRELQQSQQSSNPQTRARDIPTWKVMLFGALAGYAMWLPVYPIDAIKSRIQTDSLDPSGQKYRGMLDCFKKTMRQEGITGLYRGLVPCMLRAGPVNAATFVAYEFAMGLLRGD